MNDVPKYCDVHGANGHKIGVLDPHGVISNDGKLMLRITDGKVYSMHDQYLGVYEDGIGKTDQGHLIFTVS